MASFDVICVGSAALDTIAVVPSIPGDDERVPASAFLTAGGGPAATAAVALARLGARVGFCGVVGDDDEGAAVRDGLDTEGVDTRWLLTRPGVLTARSVVLISELTAGRTIVARQAVAPRERDIPLDASEWLHVDQVGFGPTRRALAARLPSGPASAPRLSVDAGNAISADDLRGVALYAPTLLRLRERYPDALDTSGAIDAAVRDGAQQVVATDGARGSVVWSGAGVVTVPAVATAIVSTLGAGDVFHGALLAGIVAGHDLVDAARRASAVAALSCQGLDGRSAIPDAAALDRFLLDRAGAPGPRVPTSAK